MNEPELVTIENVEITNAINTNPKATLYVPDNEHTWTYWTPLDTAETGITEEWVWERLRHRRDQLLAESDYRVLNDAPWDREPWLNYRQALRDLPNNTNDPKTAIWPTIPGA